jgi:hypothetical protein
MYNFWERFCRSRFSRFFYASHRRRILAHELSLAARGASMYIAVASLAQNKLEELFLAAVVWATLVIIAVIVAPSEKGGTV